MTCSPKIDFFLNEYRQISLLFAASITILREVVIAVVHFNVHLPVYFVLVYAGQIYQIGPMLLEPDVIKQKIISGYIAAAIKTYYIKFNDK